MRVGDDVPTSISGYSSGCFSAPHGFSTFHRSNSHSLRSSRRATLRRSSARSYNYPKLFHHSAGAREFTGKIIGRHLLSCLGVVSPRPLSLLLPLAPKGSLSDWMEEMRGSYETEGIYPVQQNTLTKVVYQVATAIAYLHRVRIVYRDLKPDNLLVWQMPPPITLPSTSSTVETVRDLRFVRSNNLCSEVRVVLSDFGVSRWRANLDGCRGYVGTPGFMAPEVLASLGEETYTHKVLATVQFMRTINVWLLLGQIGIFQVDIYALGILMASIATFQLPYHGFTNLRFQLNQHILSGGRPDIPSRVSASRCLIMRNTLVLSKFLRLDQVALFCALPWSNGFLLVPWAPTTPRGCISRNDDSTASPSTFAFCICVARSSRNRPQYSKTLETGSITNDCWDWFRSNL